MESTLVKIKELIIEELNLDLSPSDIPNDSPIFGEGLGLDSIDALELLVILESNYGIKVTDEDVAEKIFVSIETLAQYIDENKT